MNPSLNRTLKTAARFFLLNCLIHCLTICLTHCKPKPAPVDSPPAPNREAVDPRRKAAQARADSAEAEADTLHQLNQQSVTDYENAVQHYDSIPDVKLPF